MYGSCEVLEATAAALLELPPSAPNASARAAAASSSARQQCSCYTGWKGARCSEPICPQACHMEARQGICASPGVCQCLAGWSGAACDRPGCKDNCNGHGPCLAGPFPVCSCGYPSPSPSPSPSPNPCPNPSPSPNPNPNPSPNPNPNPNPIPNPNQVCPEGCSGRGECLSAGNCKCEAGWAGASCAEADCGEP